MPTYDYDDPAELAVEDVLGLLTARRDAGEFDAILADISDNVGRTIERENLIISRRYVPLTLLEETADTIDVSLIPNPERVEGTDVRMFNRSKLQVSPSTILAVETQVDHANSPAIRHLLRLSWRLLSWAYLRNPDAPASQIRPRRLSSLNCVAKSFRPWMTYDPATLRSSPVFFGVSQVDWEAVP